MTIFYVTLVFFLVINIHELGHFVSAKLFKVRVEEYGFGWPPKLVSKIVRGTRYSLNLILVGGFVKLFGKDPEEKKALSSPWSFQKKSFIEKLLIILGGIIFNLLLAFVIFYLLFLSGFPRLSEFDPDSVYVHSITKNSPAYWAGLEVGDSIISINGQRMDDYTKLGKVVASYSGQEVKLEFVRGEEIHKTTLTPSPLLGVAVSPVPIEKAGPFEALWLSARETYGVVGEVASVFYKFLSGKREGIEISGPIGIAKYSGQTARMGASYFWQFVASLSVNLAVLNFIPFPALDGGWAVLVVVEKIRRKRLSSKVVNLVNTFGFVIIIAFLVLVTIRDLVG